MEENARFLWSGYFSLKNKEDIMITWNNLDTLESFKELSNVKKVNLVEAMTGENGAERGLSAPSHPISGRSGSPGWGDNGFRWQQCG